MIALFNNNQWTVECHTWLPYKTNQFHVQNDFLFLSNFNCLKVLSMKNILINIKTIKCTPKSVLRCEFASVYVNKAKSFLILSQN